MSNSLGQIAGVDAFTPFSIEDVEQSIPARFEQQARLFPDKIAIEDPEGVLSYRDLNRRANRVARAILSVCGIGQEPVAVLAGKGAPVAAGLLGVLKAGKFYVILDASQPVARTAQILAEIPPRLLITDSARMEQAEALRQTIKRPDLKLLNLDDLPPGLSGENLGLFISAGDLAYVTFTSGSTGRPKGVMQDHRYVLHLTMVYTNSGRISAADRFALLYSPSFAGAVRDIFCSLLNGATLLTFDVRAEGLTALALWLRAKRISVFFAVATLFRHFCRLLRPEENFPDVRLVELGSETVYAGDVLLYQRHFSAASRMVVNLGGSEISPISQLLVSPTTRIEGSTVPAGYAADDVEVLIRDSEGRPVNAGTAGEIVVRSRYLARGYWGRPDLTGAVFLPDPDGGDRREFRTGDMGRLLPDGCLVHLGRRDFQVKIRGYRVETAEVEAFFTGTGLIRDVAVTAWTDAAGEQNLAAWLVPAWPETPPSPSELRTLASAALPDYMVPATFVLLDSLPVTGSGKLDRLALPDPRGSGAQMEDTLSPPRTAVEVRLTEIWSELLGRERIGLDENFFDLGGHSLLAMQVTARIAASFRVMLPPNCVFEAPTLSQLAGMVERTRKMGADEAIAAVDRDQQAPLSLAQQRLWVLDQLEDPDDTFNMVRVFRLEGQLNLPALNRALAVVSRRHENLRTTFGMPRGVPVQRIAPEPTNVLSITDLSGLPDELRDAELAATLSRAHGQRFELASGPLWNVQVIRLGPERHVLHLAMHHIISDDWSVQVLLRELSVCYRAACAGVPEVMPELAVQYADYAHWQRRWLAGDRLDRQLEYWQDQLRGAPPLIELPLDRRRRADAAFRAGVVRLSLDAELTARLRALSRASETTLFMTLLAAYALLLSTYGNPDDIVIGTAVANRHPVDTEAMIGFFVNTLALRLRWQPGATFRQIQSCAHRAALGGYAHPDVPFDRVVERLKPDRSAPYSPIFQTMFVLQNVAKQELALPGLAVTPVEPDRPSAGAAFDLTLSLKESVGGLRGTMEYNAALFDARTVDRLAAQYTALLSDVVQSPDAPASLTASRHLARDTA